MCGPDWVRMRAVCGPHAARCPSLIYSKSFVFPLPQIHQGHFGFTLTCCWDKSRLVDLLFKECLIICAFIFCLSEHHLMSEQGKNGLYPAPSSTFVFNQHASFIKFEFIWTAMNNDEGGHWVYFFNLKWCSGQSNILPDLTSCNLQEMYFLFQYYSP